MCHSVTTRSRGQWERWMGQDERRGGRTELRWRPLHCFRASWPQSGQRWRCSPPPPPQLPWKAHKTCRHLTSTDVICFQFWSHSENLGMVHAAVYIKRSTSPRNRLCLSVPASRQVRNLYLEIPKDDNYGYLRHWLSFDLDVSYIRSKWPPSLTHLKGGGASRVWPVCRQACVGGIPT